MSNFDYQAPPADGTPAPQGQHETVDIAIGGKTYSVPKELADGVNAERAQAPSAAPATPAASAQVHNEDEFWADPQKYITDQIQTGMKAERTAQDNRTAGVNAEKKFWKGFYGKNPHLKQIDSYVEHLAAQNVNALKQFNGDTTKIANYIADLGNKEMHKFGKTPEVSGVFVEGAAQPTTVVSQPTPASDDKATIRSVLNKRRQKRTNARLGT